MANSLQTLAPAQLIAQRILDTLLEEYPFLQYIGGDYSAENAEFGRAIKVQCPTAFTAGTYSRTNGYAPMDAAQTEFSVTINKHPYVTYSIRTKFRRRRVLRRLQPIARDLEPRTQSALLEFLARTNGGRAVEHAISELRSPGISNKLRRGVEEEKQRRQRTMEELAAARTARPTMSPANPERAKLKAFAALVASYPEITTRDGSVDDEFVNALTRFAASKEDLNLGDVRWSDLGFLRDGFAENMLFYGGEPMIDSGRLSTTADQNPS